MKARAFTLIELLLSITIMSIVLATATSMLSTSLNQLRASEGTFGQFQETLAAFESMTNRIATCQIKPFYDYEYPGGNTAGVPTKYELQSDLHFVSGLASGGTTSLLAGANYPSHAVFFQGTYGITQNTEWQGLGNLLNSWGYFIEFGSDATNRATFLTTSGIAPRFRYRLKELQVPAEDLKIYANNLSGINTSSASNLYSWFRVPSADPAKARTLAENIIAMIITPLTTNSSGALSNELAPSYHYDSRSYQYASSNLANRTRHRLPPMLRITLVALDENSAAKLEEENGSSVPELGIESLFTTASKYQEDIAAMEASLNAQQLRYRIFTSTIRLRNARWTNTY
ncbi:Verru_Chthon cassette protein C [Phragmitibacter flavus]|nr:Verru_Chthon cassette protein C [Phragmitibacter flavus]